MHNSFLLSTTTNATVRFIVIKRGTEHSASTKTQDNLEEKEKNTRETCKESKKSLVINKYVGVRLEMLYFKTAFVCVSSNAQCRLSQYTQRFSIAANQVYRNIVFVVSEKTCEILFNR